MTALCGGGASGPRPGYNDLVYLGSAAIEGFLTLKGLGAVAALLGPVLAGLSFQLSTYCSTDPPADPNLTASDIADAINFNDVAVSVPAIDKIRQWFGSQYWYEVCQCSTTTTPTAPAPSDPGPISTNPGLPGATAGPCFVTHAAPSWVPTGANTFLDLTTELLPATGSVVTRTSTEGGFSHTVDSLPIPPGTQGPYFLGQYVGADYGTISNGPTMRLSLFTSGGSEIDYGNIGSYANRNAGPPVTWDPVMSSLQAQWLSGGTYWCVQITNGNGAAGGSQFDFKLDIGAVCTGDVLQRACCPPDPGLDLKLAQILGLLQEVYSLIPVRAPNYAAGTTHSGLTGDGTLALAPTTTAVKVAITSTGAGYGQIGGTPLTYLSSGWLTPVTNQGPESGMRLTRDGQVIPLPEATSSLDYTLPTGQVISVQELQPG